MAYREKVIKGLEVCIDRVPGKYTCNECPYEIDGNYCEINLAKDAIDLLKEQEAEISRVSNEYLVLVGKVSKQPQIVRCKDCKWFLSDNICGNKRLSDQEDIATLGQDWFCADGERKET